MTVLVGTLEPISRQARPYPAHLLPDGGTALALFSAAFLGHNDVIHFARKNMTATCVDIDCGRLDEMRGLYPEGWEWLPGDAWEIAETLRDDGRVFDAVSVDTFTGDATRRSIRALDLWCSLAARMVTCTHTGEPYLPPDGWNASLYPRAANVNWLVLTR